MLSPVRDLENPSTDLSKPKHLSVLNSELSKINARKESVITDDKHNLESDKDNPEKIKSPSRSHSESKIRKVSRFKVSVVSEPDQSKLVIPEEHKTVKVEELNIKSGNNSVHTTPVKSKSSIKEDMVESEIELTNELKIAKHIISSTMQSLQENLSTVNFQQGKFTGSK